jgi:hypothetical protein
VALKEMAGLRQRPGLNVKRADQHRRPSARRLCLRAVQSSHVSMGPVLAALGVKLIVAGGPQAMERLAGRLLVMTEGHVRSRAYTRTVSEKMLSKWGRLGAKAKASRRLKDIARKE